MARYTVYVMDVSSYSGKFEAYLRYKEIPCERVDVDHPKLFEVFRQTGTMKVSAVRLDDGRWLKDSTVMIRWFEGQHPEASVLPSDRAMRFLANLIEDYADPRRAAVPARLASDRRGLRVLRADVPPLRQRSPTRPS